MRNIKSILMAALAAASMFAGAAEARADYTNYYAELDMGTPSNISWMQYNPNNGSGTILEYTNYVQQYGILDNLRTTTRIDYTTPVNSQTVPGPTIGYITVWGIGSDGHWTWMGQWPITESPCSSHNSWISIDFRSINNFPYAPTIDWGCE